VDGGGKERACPRCPQRRAPALTRRDNATRAHARTARRTRHGAAPTRQPGRTSLLPVNRRFHPAADTNPPRGVAPRSAPSCRLGLRRRRPRPPRVTCLRLHDATLHTTDVPQVRGCGARGDVSRGVCGDRGGHASARRERAAGTCTSAGDTKRRVAAIPRQVLATCHVARADKFRPRATLRADTFCVLRSCFPSDRLVPLSSVFESNPF
jgi:hypothetical protein